MTGSYSIWGKKRFKNQFRNRSLNLLCIHNHHFINASTTLILLIIQVIIITVIILIPRLTFAIT